MNNMCGRAWGTWLFHYQWTVITGAKTYMCTVAIQYIYCATQTHTRKEWILVCMRIQNQHYCPQHNNSPHMDIEQYSIILTWYDCLLYTIRSVDWILWLLMIVTRGLVRAEVKDESNVNLIDQAPFRRHAACTILGHDQPQIGMVIGSEGDVGETIRLARWCLLFLLWGGSLYSCLTGWRGGRWCKRKRRMRSTDKWSNEGLLIWNSQPNLFSHGQRTWQMVVSRR